MFRMQIFFFTTFYPAIHAYIVWRLGSGHRMTSLEQLSSTQKIRAALHRDVQAISAETCHLLGLEISKPAMEIVAELVYKKLSVYGADLEAFAKHAKRATVNTEDVKLLVRRCPSLKSQLNSISPTVPSTNQKKRKTVSGRQPDTPIQKAREPEPQIPKQKDPEVPISKPRQLEVVASTSKEHLNKESEKMDVESMITDDLIDLTFD